MASFLETSFILYLHWSNENEVTEPVQGALPLHIRSSAATGQTNSCCHRYSSAHPSDRWRPNQPRLAIVPLSFGQGSAPIGPPLNIGASFHQVVELFLIVKEHSIGQHPVVVVGKHPVGRASRHQLQTAGDCCFIIDPTPS